MKLKNWFFPLVLLVFIITTNGQDRVVLSGRVTGRDGSPISNAKVRLLYEPCKGCTDYIIPSVSTDEDGNFAFLDNYGIRNGRIFVEETVPAGFWNPIYAPQYKLSRLSRFYGTPVVLSKTQSLDLGNVEPTINYEKIKLRLQKIFPVGANLLNRISKQLELTILNEEGAPVATQRIIPSSAFDNKLNIKLALPRGIWNLTFTTDIMEKPLVRKVIVNTNLREKISYIVDTNARTSNQTQGALTPQLR